MKVYRITHPDERNVSARGNGTYYAGVYTLPTNTRRAMILSSILCKYTRPSNSGHPGPHNDGLELDPNFVCGFASLEQLREWFDLEFLFELIVDAGMVVREFNVPVDAVKFGGRQIMIDDRWIRGEGEIINDEL